MSRTSSTYVSPNLRPTTPWGHQTSTGVFRPPPAFSLSSRDSIGVSSKDTPPYDIIQDSSKCSKDNFSSWPHPINANTALVEVNSHDDMSSSAARPRPSPSLQPNAPPFYPGQPQQQHGIARDTSRFSYPSPNVAAVNARGTELPSPGAYSIDHIMRSVTYSVHVETDLFAAQKESNRALESELRRYHDQRPAMERHLEQMDEALNILRETRREQLELLGTGADE